TTVTDVANKLRVLEHSVNEVVLERQPIIHTAILALIGRQHHLTVGAPGIAKSMTVDEIVKRISGVKFYDILMSRFTEPGEVVGPPKVSKLVDEDVLERNTHGMLPEANIGFLDEVFKGNSSILNYLLRIM